MRIVITTRTPAANNPIVFRPTNIVIPHRPMRVLDFDVECRPLDWYGGDLNSKEITALAYAWCDQPEQVTCHLLGEELEREMLAAFLTVYQQADMVTGHYIRGFDLPLINAMLTEQQMPVLPPKLTQDTKLDLVRRHGLSGSQENLGAILGLFHPKVGMNQARWREANRLTPDGLALVRERVTGDVRQHIEMRRRLLELGYLAPPVVWKPGGVAAAEYTP